MRFGPNALLRRLLFLCLCMATLSLFTSSLFKRPPPKRPGSILNLGEVPLRYSPRALLVNGSWVSPEDFSDLEEHFTRDRKRRRSSEERYLTYVPTDGFGNQLVSFTTALAFAWLTDRTLVLPPILGHFEGPARGNCLSPRPDRISDPFEVRRVYNNLLRTKIAKNDYIPLASLLDLTEHSKHVPMIDARELLQQNPTILSTAYEVPQDCCVCQNTVWLPFPLEPVNETISQQGIQFLSIDEHLKRRRHEQVLDLGTVYFPNFHNIVPLFEWPFVNIFLKVGQLMKYVPYAPSINEFSLALSNELNRRHLAYQCIHIRAQESLFSPEKEGHIRHLHRRLRNVTADQQFERAPAPPVLVLSDTDGEEYQELIKGLSQDFYLFQLKDVFGQEVEEFQKELDFRLDPMHLEIKVCSCAQNFIGHPSSTFSRRIISLKNSCEFEKGKLRKS